jgi:hypothetical protein
MHNLSVTCKWVSEKTSSRQFVNRVAALLTVPLSTDRLARYVLFQHNSEPP